MLFPRWLVLLLSEGYLCGMTHPRAVGNVLVFCEMYAGSLSVLVEWGYLKHQRLISNVQWRPDFFSPVFTVAHIADEKVSKDKYIYF